MRKINTRLFLILVAIVALCAGAVAGLHRLQAGNIAEALLWQADQAEKDGKLDRAAKYLGRYLEFAREDLDTRERLGLLVSEPQLATTPQRRARARFVIEQVLAKDPQRHDARKRLTELLIAGRTFEAAKEHLNHLEKHQPNSAAVALLAGQWHEAQARLQAAVQAYRRAIELDAGHVEAHVRLIGLLKRLDFGKGAQHANEVERLIVSALKKSPHDAGILSLAAEHAQEKGNTQIALGYLEDGLNHHPAEPRLYLALARIHGDNGKRPQAIATLRLGLEKVKKEHHYALRWSLANLLLDENLVDDARKVADELRDANATSAKYLKARCQMQRGRWFEAAQQFDKIRPGVKGSKELAYQLDLYLGNCYEQLDEPLLQLTAYQRALESDPTSVIARRGLAAARAALGQTADALQVHQELIDLAKDPQEAARRRIEHVRLRLQYTPAKAAKDFARLGQDLEDIEKTLGNSLEVALLRSELKFRQGDKAKAESLLQDLVKEHPSRHEPWLALINLAEPKDAPALMQAAEMRFKDKAEFRLGQIRYWAHFYEAGGQKPLQELETVAGAFEPRERAPLLQALAEAHYYAGKYADSARVLARLALVPTHAQDVRIRMQMLELAFLQDDDAQARRVLDEIKRLDGENGIDWSFGEAMRLVHAAKKGKKEGLEAARHLLTVAAAQRPNWHPIIQVRAEVDELQGRPDQAIANYRRAIDLGSRDPQATKQLIVLLAQAQRHDEVEQVLARMHQQQGATDEVVRYFVANSVNRRDYKKAEFLIKQIVAANSSNYRDHLWMGQIHSLSGQAPAEAEKALRRAVALAPQQPETWIGLVRHFIGSGQHAAARTEIENAKQALPEDRRASALAQCYELAGFLMDAAESHKAALTRHPASAQVQRMAADFYLRASGFAEAEALYRKLHDRAVASRDDDALAAKRGLALALVQQQRPHKTREALQLAGLSLDEQGLVQDIKPASADNDRVLQARVLGALNHHGLRLKAVAMLEPFHNKNALAADDQFFLARLLVQTNDDAGWAKARGVLKGLVAAQPKSPRYLAYAAQQSIQRKEYADAEAFIVRLEALERERQTAAGGFGSIELRAKMLEQRGLGTQAIALLSSYCEQPGAAPVRRLLLAQLHGRLGQFREAIDLCEQVRPTGPLFNEANATAVAILRANKPSEAQPTRLEHWRAQRVRVETSLRDALVKDARDIPLRMHLADLMELEGKLNEVEKLCRDVLKDNDTHLVALNNLSWLLGQKSSTAAEAIALIERAIDKHGPRPELLDTRAVAQLTLGNHAKALHDLKRVADEAPTAARLFHLCRAYERARDTTAAQATLRRANDLGLSAQHLHPEELPEFQRVTTELSKR